MFVGAVEVNSGMYDTFNSFENWDEFADLVVASASAPGYFPP